MWCSYRGFIDHWVPHTLYVTSNPLHRPPSATPHSQLGYTLCYTELSCVVDYTPITHHYTPAHICVIDLGPASTYDVDYTCVIDMVYRPGILSSNIVSPV